MNPTTRNLFLWSAIAAVLFVIFQMFPGSSSHQGNPPVAYSQFINDVNDNKVAEVTLSGQHVLGKTKDGRNFITYAPETQTMVTKLLEKDVVIRALPADHDLSIFQLLLPWLPILLLVGLTLYSFRQIQSGGNRAMGFGKSKARLRDDKAKKVTFEDVAGIDEAKQELQEIVDFLKDPQKFQRLGGRIPRGVLLVGPPGTGKTLLAKAIAGEAEVPFFSISGSDFVEMFVGVGASRVRDMFEQAKKNAPCIIFMDEIDAVGRHRGVGLGGGNDEREQTLNQLLVEMDGFEENQSVILVAATNRPDILDPALLRPGRFDRQVVVPNPDVSGREQILKVHMRKVPLSPNVDARVIARGTPGFSGADLANLVNEAALMAARRGKLMVGMHEFEQAKDKVMMGAERRSMVMTEEEKKLTAYHEGGHAIIAYYTPDSDPIHKATIIPRGRALGMVMRLPEGDRISMSRSRLYADLKVAMGGRLAEELIFGYDKVTTGASSDIKMATNIARRMITEWGMSDRLGFQSYGAQDEGYMGHTTAHAKMFSEATSQVVDEEVAKILDGCYQETKNLLQEQINSLHQLAQVLLERETLTGEEIRIVLEGGILPAPIGFNDTNSPRPSVPLSGKPKPAE
ncbi:ATP-dependent zinc metalloprotease FtsH [Candidatus Finniella inopinata]|uniref:ATP-dependent zinc metalloprotease FtsH n=1 Tax=Candidatus Finniella inopinata TaxID=1696036 RepID=A0A4Q7DF14_9PROT|nr:ATP-dependent zinc metalloprotease FtsH [Candidatus Finniella inopinata]RZI45331.1 ATP-dependent metallopeptidase FtsH/Yme1/Tma family protein [Candidatus Finniella inopinata]